MRQRRLFTGRICPLISCLLLAGPQAFGDVLHDQDNGPLTGIFGIPDSTEGSFLLSDGAHAWAIAVTTASHSIVDQKPGEVLQLDGETTRYEFRYHYGITDRFELGIELPVVEHKPGRLDSVIDAWHGFFGLPDGYRPLQPQDELQFFYVDVNAGVIEFTEQSLGLGDIRLFSGWQLSAGENSATALRFGLKFPTGDSRKLHGSGSPDVSAGLAGDGSRLWGIQRLNGFYRFGAVYLGDPYYLAERANSWIGYLSTGLGYDVTDRLELRLQGALRTAAYDSAVKNLGDQSITVTFGANVRIGERYELSLGVGEDINVRSAPDVTFVVGLRYRGD